MSKQWRQVVGMSLIVIGLGLGLWVVRHVVKTRVAKIEVGRERLVERNGAIDTARLPTAGLPMRVHVREPKVWTLDGVFGGSGGAGEIGALTVTAGGDVSLARAVNAKLVSDGGEGEVLGEVGSWFAEADLATVNLEAPLMEGCPVTTEGMRLCGGENNVVGLTQAGVDVVSLANNHTRDFGEAGLKKTEDLMARNGILAFDDGGMGVKEAQGVKVGMVGFNMVGKKAEEEKIKLAFGKATEWADVVIGWFHWGQEYTAKPTEKQRMAAHWAVEGGADLVLGSHPHWVQAVEIYKSKLIVYSLGNLVFDQLWSEETREGVVGRFVFYKNELEGVEWVPIYIDSDYRPVVASGERREKILMRMREASEKLAGEGV